MSAFTLVYTRAWQVNAYSNKVNIPFPNLVKTGQSSSAATYRLIDSSANFQGIQVGDIIFGGTSPGLAYVTSVVNNTTLDISEDLFTGTAEDYEIYQGQNYGCYIYVPSGLDYTSGMVLEVETIGGDIISFFNPPAGVLPVQVSKVRTSTNFFKLVALW